MKALMIFSLLLSVNTSWSQTSIAEGEACIRKNTNFWIAFYALAHNSGYCFNRGSTQREVFYEFRNRTVKANQMRAEFLRASGKTDSIGFYSYGASIPENTLVDGKALCQIINQEDEKEAERFIQDYCPGKGSRFREEITKVNLEQLSLEEVCEKAMPIKEKVCDSK